MVRFCILTIASGDTINFNVSTTGQFLGVKSGAGTKDTDLDALERITTVANPSIATKGNALYPVFGFGALLKSEKFYLSASIPNVLNPEKFVDEDTFIGSEKPVTYLLAGTSINTGVFGSKMKPFISTKLIPDGENQDSRSKLKTKFILGFVNASFYKINLYLL